MWAVELEHFTSFIGIDHSSYRRFSKILSHQCMHNQWDHSSFSCCKTLKKKHIIIHNCQCKNLYSKQLRKYLYWFFNCKL